MSVEDKEKKDEQKPSFVSPEDAVGEPPDSQVNELLKMPPLSRLVLAVERLTQETTKARIALEKLVELFTIAKPKSEATSTTQPTSQPASQPKPMPQPAPAQTGTDTEIKLKKLQGDLGEELTIMLVFETQESSNFILVKPRQFLGSDNFAKIVKIIKDNGGDYVSAGKDSHFRVPKLVK